MINKYLGPHKGIIKFILIYTIIYFGILFFFKYSNNIYLMGYNDGTLDMLDLRSNSLNGIETDYIIRYI